MEKYLNSQSWSDSGVMDLPDEVVERKFQMLQLEINHPLQSGSSSGFSQLESPRVPTTPTSFNPQREKKRKADREYRCRQKEVKKKLTSDSKKISEENNKLTKENDNLKRGRDETQKGLDSANKEAKKMKGEITKFKAKIKSQESFVEDCSQKFLNDVHQEQEVREWKNKIETISSNKEDYIMKEREHFLRIVAGLERENKLLEVQVQVLSSRILESTDDTEET
jgi:chromosome segregation ATPase